MQGRCPNCGCNGSLELFLDGDDLRPLMQPLARLPSDVGEHVLRYIGLFRPQKQKLNPKKAVALLQEIKAMLEQGATFDRQHIQLPSHQWAAALKICLEADLRRPIKDHNYLLRVMLNRQQQRQKPSEQAVQATPETTPDQPVSPRSNQGLQKAFVAHKPDPIEALEPACKEALFKQASAELAQEGIKPFLCNEFLIKARMVEILEKTT